MRLSTLLAALPEALRPRETPGGDDPVIRGVVYDSRAVSPGDLFVALRGEVADGHDHLAAAVRLGAAALLVQDPPRDPALAGCPTARVPDTRRALAYVATRFFGSPADELTLVGVTGTNGKTSTTHLLESILRQAGRRPGLIGTLEIRYANERVRTLNTTPESLDLQRTLRAMRTRNVDVVAMEVSSHGLALGRVDGCRFAVGAFTNLTQDHLDFHGDMQTYREAKRLLFERYLAPGAAAVINVDDPAAPEFARVAEGAGARLWRVSRRTGADVDVCVEDAQLGLDATRARVRLHDALLDVTLPLLGDFNLENLAVAVGVAGALGIETRAIAEGVAGCPQVPGRTQRVGAEIQGAPTVLVDYAHTPDAVEKLLRAIRPLAGARLITVFGCGGDRDRGKRAPMAEAVARWSDRAVATSDNPRTEDPERILDDVEAGLDKLRRVGAEALDATPASWARVADRREAIGLALALACPEDVVVIAGKGHEDYQIVGRERLPFDDREEALHALERRSRA